MGGVSGEACRRWWWCRARFRRALWDGLCVHRITAARSKLRICRVAPLPTPANVRLAYRRMRVRRAVQGLRSWKVRRRSLTQASGFSQGMKWPPWSWALTLTWLNQSACGPALNARTRSSAVWMPGGFS